MKARENQCLQEKESNHRTEAESAAANSRCLVIRIQLLNAELIRAVLWIGDVWEKKKLVCLWGRNRGKEDIVTVPVVKVNTCNWIAMQ